MATNWITIEAEDVQKFLASSVIGGTNEVDAEGEKRLDGQGGIIQAVVDRIRDAIDIGNRTPLSLTANTIPKGARWHAMALIAQALVDAQPQMSDFALKDGWQKRVDLAEKWLLNVEEGKQPGQVPTDPDPATVPSGTEWGDVMGTEIGNAGSKVDLNTDDAAMPLVPPSIIDGGGP